MDKRFTEQEKMLLGYYGNRAVPQMYRMIETQDKTPVWEDEYWCMMEQWIATYTWRAA